MNRTLAACLTRDAHRRFDGIPNITPTFGSSPVKGGGNEEKGIIL